MIRTPDKVRPGAADEYDTIVIGSGIGGLTTAAILARVAGQRVLVLERHFKLGGFTHTFQRKGYEWDAGVHYVGEMHDGALSRQVMDLVTGGAIRWNKMGGDFERYLFPEGSFDVPDDEALFKRRLIERFPEEERAIERYFVDLRRAQSWFVRWLTAKQFPAFLRPAFELYGRRLAMQNTAEYMERFESPFLRAILCGQWPDFGACPLDSAFAWHSTVAADFLAGGYYPVGGSQQISERAKEVIEDHGGRCLVSHEVAEIVVERGRAVGVRGVRKQKPFEYRAKRVISNAGAPTTFTKLLPEPYGKPEREKVARLRSGPSAQILFLGLNDDPSKHGFTDANYWIFGISSHNAHERYRLNDPDRVDGVFLTFQSLKDPLATKHTAQIINFSREEDWAPHSSGDWMRRGDAYERRKEEIAERMLQFVEERLPGVRALVEYQELSTPLSVKTFTNHSQGMVYGQLCDANRLGRDRWNITTSVKNLLLTGSDVGSPGINGAMFGGMMAAGKVMGLSGLPRIMHAAQSYGKSKSP